MLLESFEFSKTRGHAIGAPRLTIAPRVEPQEITWQLVEVSIAVSIGSACSVRTSVRNGTSLKLYADGSHIFAAARDARAHGWQPNCHEPPAGPPALLTPRKRTQAQS